MANIEVRTVKTDNEFTQLILGDIGQLPMHYLNDLRSRDVQDCERYFKALSRIGENPRVELTYSEHDNHSRISLTRRVTKYQR